MLVHLKHPPEKRNLDSLNSGGNLQLGSELAGGTTLLTLTSLTAAVTALAVTTATATEGALAALLTTEHATGGSVRPLGLDVGSGDDLSGEVEPLAEVVETLGGEGVVVVLPRELGLDVAARGQRLASLDDIKVADAGLVGRLIAKRVSRISMCYSFRVGGCPRRIEGEFVLASVSVSAPIWVDVAIAGWSSFDMFVVGMIGRQQKWRTATKPHPLPSKIRANRTVQGWMCVYL